MITQIEAILSSKPLCPLSSDPSDFQCLTPDHFLIGTCLTAYLELQLSDIPSNRLPFFQLCSRIQKHFWKRWSRSECLHRLQTRSKWVSESKNVQVNELVLVK